MSPAAWGDDTGTTWANATDEIREQFALVRLYWYYRMRETGGPDGSELDDLVADEAAEAAEWFRPILDERAGIEPLPVATMQVMTWELRRPDGTVLDRALVPTSAMHQFGFSYHPENEPSGTIELWTRLEDGPWEKRWTKELR
jgi:hypothetical protein